MTIKNSNLNNLPSLQTASGRMRKSYTDILRKVPWKTRLLYSAIAILIVGLISWRLGFSPLTSTLVGVGTMVAINLVITVLPWLNILIIWTINLATLPLATFGYGVLQSADDGLDEARFMLTLSTLIVSSLLYTLIAYLYLPGRLWLNLSVGFLLQGFGGFGLMSLFPINAVIIFGGFLGILLMYTYAIVRIIISKRKPKVSFPSKNETGMSSLQTSIIKQFAKTQRKAKIIPYEEDTLIVVSPRSVSLIIPTQNDTPLIVHKDKLLQEKLPVNDYAAHQIALTNILKTTVNREEIATIITGPKMLRTKHAAKVTLATREKQKMGEAIFINDANLPEYLVNLRQAHPITNKHKEAFSILETKQKDKKEKDAGEE